MNTEFKVTISDGNQKIGKVPNLSMTPIKSCARHVPCGLIPEGKKRSLCYAHKSYLQYPGVRAAWGGNYDYWLANPYDFARDFIAQLSKRKKLPYFRWFVGGDIPNADFVLFMVNIAKKFPDTKFLSFTKQYAMVNNYIFAFGLDGRESLPKNLSIVFSAWPDYPMSNRYEFPVAWYYDWKNEDTRINGNWTHPCPGSCVTCKFCWSPDSDVLFEAH